MTDRINALTVVLDEDVREDDIEPLVNAIRQMRGVLAVDTHVASVTDHIAEQRVRIECRGKIIGLLQEMT